MACMGICKKLGLTNNESMSVTVVIERRRLSLESITEDLLNFVEWIKIKSCKGANN